MHDPETALSVFMDFSVESEELVEELWDPITTLAVALDDEEDLSRERVTRILLDPFLRLEH